MLRTIAAVLVVLASLACSSAAAAESSTNQGPANVNIYYGGLKGYDTLRSASFANYTGVGFAACSNSVCGAFKKVRGNLVLKVPSRDTLQLGTYGYVAKNGTELSFFNLTKKSAIPLRLKATIRGKVYSFTLNYASALLYDPTPPWNKPTGGAGL